MKKYIKPISKSIKVETENLLADSFGNAHDSQGHSGRPGGFAKSAHGDEWDFDGVEEY